MYAYIHTCIQSLSHASHHRHTTNFHHTLHLTDSTHTHTHNSSQSACMISMLCMMPLHTHMGQTCAAESATCINIPGKNKTKQNPMMYVYPYQTHVHLPSSPCISPHNTLLKVTLGHYPPKSQPWTKSTLDAVHSNISLEGSRKPTTLLSSHHTLLTFTGCLDLYRVLSS